MAPLDHDPQLASPNFSSAPARMAAGRLSQAERGRLIGEIIAAYMRSRRALSHAPIADVVAGLRSEFPLASSSGDKLEEARSLGWAVSKTLNHLPGDTRCLIQSLVLTRVLARRGIPATLVIGARSAPDFLAHAWVEYGGDPVLNPGDGSFGRLVEL
jgi:hypothetical protein